MAAKIRAPVHSRLRLHLGPSGWGLAAAGGAFAAAAVGLSQSGVQLRTAQYVWTAVASLVPGAVAFTKAESAVKDKGAIRSLTGQVHALTGQVRSLLREMAEREAEEKVERTNTALVLANLGQTLAEVTAAVLDHQPDLSAIGRFVTIVLDTLYEVLQTKGGISRSPLRVMFLQYQQSPLPKPGGPPVVLAGVWPRGYSSSVCWDIREDEEDAKTALRIMNKEIPWRRGGVVFDDISKPEYEDNQVLRPPEPEVASYCRVAVANEHHRHGILCIDSWVKGALDRADQEVASSFALLLASGLSLAVAFDVVPPA